MKKRIIQIFMFLTLFFTIFGCVNYVFRDKGESHTTYSYKDERKNSIDVIFLGSSQIVRSVMPMRIWEDTGIPSYNLSASATSIPQMYYLAELALETQSPKVIIADMSWIDYGEKIVGNERFHSVFDNFTFSPAKYKAVVNLVEKEKWLEMFMPIYIYHSGWQNISKDNFKSLHDTVGLKGSDLANTTYPMIYSESSTDECAEIPDVAMEYTKKLVKLCKENDITLVFTAIPTANHTGDNYAGNYQSYLNALDEYAKEEKIAFYNGYIDAAHWGLDYYDDFIDPAHTNVRGAEKVTRKMEEILSNYQLDDKRDYSEYKGWNSIAGIFDEYYKDLCGYKQYNNGEIIDFKLGGNSDDYFVAGLLAPEETHRWNSFFRADAFMIFEEIPEETDETVISIKINGIFPGSETQNLSLYINDECIGERDCSNEIKDYYYKIPRNVIKRGINLVSLRFTSIDSSIDYENPKPSIALSEMKINWE